MNKKQRNEELKNKGMLLGLLGTGLGLTGHAMANKNYMDVLDDYDKQKMEGVAKVKANKMLNRGEARTMEEALIKAHRDISESLINNIYNDKEKLVRTLGDSSKKGLKYVNLGKHLRKGGAVLGATGILANMAGHALDN